jgi:hypothetical protein
LKQTNSVIRTINNLHPENNGNFNIDLITTPIEVDSLDKMIDTSKTYIYDGYKYTAQGKYYSYGAPLFNNHYKDYIKGA